MNEAVEKAFVEITGNDPIYHRKRHGVKRTLIMSGLPFSGKSYLSTQICEEMDGRVILVRSDTIRPIVAKYMGRDSPMYDQEEHENTFALGSALLKKAMELNMPAIADATNLRDEYRKWAVEPTLESGGEGLVVFLRLDVNTAIGRALKGAKYDSAATGHVYSMLKKENEPIEACTTPYVVIDSNKDMKPHVKNLAKWLAGERNEVPDTVLP